MLLTELCSLLRYSSRIIKRMLDLIFITIPDWTLIQASNVK